MARIAASSRPTSRRASLPSLSIENPEPTKKTTSPSSTRFASRVVPSYRERIMGTHLTSFASSRSTPGALPVTIPVAVAVAIAISVPVAILVVSHVRVVRRIVPWGRSHRYTGRASAPRGSRRAHPCQPEHVRRSMCCRSACSAGNSTTSRHASSKGSTPAGSAKGGGPPPAWWPRALSRESAEVTSSATFAARSSGVVKNRTVSSVRSCARNRSRRSACGPVSMNRRGHDSSSLMRKTSVGRPRSRACRYSSSTNEYWPGLSSGGTKP